MVEDTAADATRADALSSAWQEALRLFDADLLRRGAAARTRRAYGFDCAQFALWCTTNGHEPTDVTTRILRRYAAALGERDVVAATVARKLAALRSLYRTLREHGHMAANPADLVPAPKRPSKLPRVLKADEVADLLDRIPQTTPLDVRDRALFELAYACGLRAEELVNLDRGSLDFDAEEVRVEGKGGKTRIVPIGESAVRALARYVERARPALQADRAEHGVVLVQVRPAAVDQRRAAAPARVVPARRAAGWGAPARAASLVRHAPARRRRRPARHPGDAGPQQHLDDADLHPCRVREAQVRVCACASEGVRNRDGDQRQGH